MLLYTILYQFLILIPGTLQMLPKDIQSFLTQNNSINWFINNTIFGNITSSCDICCLNMSANNARKICGKHTLCRYKSDLPGPNCRGFISVEFTPEEKSVIIDAHNTVRNKVATGGESRGNPGPQMKASNMRSVSWDAELEMLALRWARQCIFAHDLCRDVKRFPVGQNIAKGGFSLNNDLNFIINWYDYVEYSNSTVINGYHLTSNDALSQYTQLVWADTYLIGCARVAFQMADGADVTFREHFVCNYGPTGNIPGHPVYKIGTPCSQCPTGTGCSTEYPGLCASEIIYTVKFDNKTTKRKRNCVNRITGNVSILIVLLMLYSIKYCLLQ